MAANGPSQLDLSNLTYFDSNAIPNISMDNYLFRIMRFSRATSRSMLMALYYIDELANDPQCPVEISRFNIHRLV
jgi:hypothetical protein